MKLAACCDGLAEYLAGGVEGTLPLAIVSLISVIKYTVTAVPLCQTPWSSNERRFALKKDSSSRVTNVNAVQGAIRESDATDASQVVAPPAAQTNAVVSFNNNGSDRSGNGNRFSS